MAGNQGQMPERRAVGPALAILEDGSSIDVALLSGVAVRDAVHYEIRLSKCVSI